MTNEAATVRLMNAAKHGNAAEALRALECGADINFQDSLGWTPAMLCCAGGHAACLKVLIDAGCDINAKDVKGRTALMWASSDLGCASLLIVAHVDIHAQDGCGWDAMKWANLFLNNDVTHLLQAEIERSTLSKHLAFLISKRFASRI